jgi:hypothetical protein
MKERGRFTEENQLTFKEIILYAAQGVSSTCEEVVIKYPREAGFHKFYEEARIIIEEKRKTSSGHYPRIFRQAAQIVLKDAGVSDCEVRLNERYGREGTIFGPLVIHRLSTK